MEHNPYTAPQSVVADAVVPIGRRPRSVFSAVLLLALALVLSALLWRGDFRHFDEGGIISALWGALKAGIAIWLCVQIARGSNWARYMQLAIVVLGFVSYAFVLWAALFQTPQGVRIMLAPSQLVLALVPSLLRFVALYLLFFPGRDWFRPRAR